MTKPILCIDFDGVLHSYTSGWQGIDVITDPPVDGAIAFLWEAIEVFDVCVFSTRNSSPAGIAAMRSWIDKYDEEYRKSQMIDASYGVTRWIRFPLEKPPALVSIDDRAIQFAGKFPKASSLLKFQPWNKSQTGPIEDGVYHIEYIDSDHVRLTRKAP